MNYPELYNQAMKGDADALKTMNELAGSGNEEVQYLLSCVYDNPDSPFQDTELGMHWLKTSAGYGYEPARKKMQELPLDIKKQFGFEPKTSAQENVQKSGNILLFTGRMSPLEYFLGMLLANGCYFIAHGVFSADAEDPQWLALDVILRLLLIYLNLSFVASRLHDAGHSGWWALVPFAPLIALFLPREEADNKYDPK